MIDTLKKNRIYLSKLRAAVEPHEGKYWNKLGKDARESIENARLACIENDVSCQFLSYAKSMDAPTVTLDYVQKMLDGVEREINLWDDLSTDPLVSEWGALAEKLASLSKEARERGNASLFHDAKRLGLVRFTVNW
jgi:hypothetical protein